jgi:sucrose-6-phosphate hydrolase SacC (GH32 family)
MTEDFSLNLKSILKDRKNQFKEIINIIKEVKKNISEELKKENEELDKIINKIKNLQKNISKYSTLKSNEIKKNSEEKLYKLEKSKEEMNIKIQKNNETNILFKEYLINEEIFKEAYSFMLKNNGYFNNYTVIYKINEMNNINNSISFDNKIIEANKYFDLILNDKEIIGKDENNLLWNIKKIKEKQELLLNSKENIEI